MGHGILLSGGAEVDFNIHGVFQYSFFGHPVWITTSHICILIVMLLLVAFAIAANRCMAKASQVPGSFQNVVEMIVDRRRRSSSTISAPSLSSSWSATYQVCWVCGRLQPITA